MPSNPFPSALAPRSPALGARRPPSAAVARLLCSGDSQRLLDLGDDPGFRFEELLCDGLPAAQRFDREQTAGRWEPGGTGDPGDHRAIAVFNPDRLTGGGEQVVDEALRR